MPLCVLKNEVQSFLEDNFLNFRFKEGYDKDDEALLDPIIGHDREMIKPVFNRVGYYRNGKLCWREFRLPSGRIVAALSDQRQFRYDLDMFHAMDSPIPDVEWEMVSHLVSRRIIQDCHRFRMEGNRRHIKRMEIDSRKRLISFRKRVKKAIQEKNKSKGSC